ncbi:conserved hypothetical protein [Novosphingobium sp. KN65.2]|nr:conserved hypothetical protein [Novosphingobium sp. KN65.2]
MEISSDQALFHKLIGNLAAAIEHRARAAGAYDRLERASTVFLVIKPDNSAELWIDRAAMVAYTTLKRPGPLKAGTVLFENDTVDITGIWFPHVDVGPADRILCIIREGWRFGLFFDFNRGEGNELSIDDARRSLGRMVRKMRYADLYAALAHEPTFSAIVSVGWFPFLELMKGEFRGLLDAQEAGFELDDAEGALIEKFDAERLGRMFDRWMERPHLKSREAILRPAISGFNAKEPVAVIKIILSEIEGVMSDVYFEANGVRSHRIPKLLEFMISLAEQRARGNDTLFFPVEFGKYLKDYTYAGFHPGDIGSAGSRHAVSHGAVASELYTMPRALQALLTLDQLAFYT